MYDPLGRGRSACTAGEQRGLFECLAWPLRGWSPAPTRTAAACMPPCRRLRSGRTEGPFECLAWPLRGWSPAPTRTAAACIPPCRRLHSGRTEGPFECLAWPLRGWSPAPTRTAAACIPPCRSLRSASAAGERTACFECQAGRVLKPLQVPPVAQAQPFSVRHTPKR